MSFGLDEREQAKQFAGYFKQLEDRLAALERSNQLNNASIEGGSLDIYDEEGTLKGSIGVQPDGGVALVPDPINTEPPPIPTAPTVESALAGLLIGWDGQWDDSAEAPSDFSLIQVHVGTTEGFTPNVTTQVATITASLGGSVTVHIEGYDPVWVCLVGQNTAALTGDPSPKVQGQARQAVGQDLVDGMVTEVKLAQNAVTAAKIALEAVTSDKVKAGAINDLLLADDAVTAAKLAAGAVNSTALADGAVLNEKLAANAVTQAKLANGAVTELALANEAVTAAKVAAAAIDSTKLAEASVTAAAIAAGSVQTAALAAGAVAAGKVAADTITSRELAANSVTASEISAGAVTATAIAAGSITTDKLTVTGGTNILPDPSFEGAVTAALILGLSYATQDKTKGNGSATSLKIDCRSATAVYRDVPLTLIPALAGDQLYLATDYFLSADWAGNSVNIHARWEDAAGTVLGYGVVGTPGTPTLGAWAKVSGTVTAPAGTTRAAVRVQAALVTAGDAWFDNAALRPLVPGVQIADGAITTPKMTVGSIQGDRIAVGTLAADRITSGSITTSQLNVTTAASVVQKLYDAGADAARWRIGGTSTTTATVPSNLTSVQVADAQSGGYVMRAVGWVGAAWRPDILIPFDPNVLYRVSATVRQTVAASDTAQQRFFMGVAGVAADGVTLVNTAGAAASNSQHYVAANGANLTAGAGWQRVTGYLKGYAAPDVSAPGAQAPSPTAPGVLHASARYISPFMFVNHSGGTGTAEVDMITIEVVETGAVQTVNISDGAITTPKLLAGAVTTEKLTALGVTAEKIASLAITTDKLNALAVTADKLAVNSVTATKIAAGAVEATHIKAGAITADKLDAAAINGKTITGATIQTAATGPRIVMNSSSFVGYGTGGNKIGLEPNSAYPYIYWTSDDGTNRAIVNVSGNASDANLGLNSGTFVDSADSANYKWRTFFGNDFWVAERVNAATSVPNGARLAMTKSGVSLGAGPGGAMTLLAEGGIRAAGVLRADNISTGVVSITPVPNSPTSVTLSGGSIKGTNFRAFVTANTAVPGTQVLGVSCSGVSSAGMTIWLTRTNNQSTSVFWMIIGED